MVMTEMMMIVVTLVAVGLALASFRRGKLTKTNKILPNYVVNYHK